MGVLIVLIGLMPFNLVKPADTAWTNKVVTFVWTDAQADIYALRIDDTTIGITGDTTVTETLNLEGLHYWYVMAYDAVLRDSLSSDTFVIRIDTTAPDTAVLRQPAPGVVIDSTQILFAWSNEQDAGSPVYYNLEIAKNDTLNIILDTILSDTQIVLVLSEGLFYWRVWTLDSVGNWNSWSGSYFWIDTSPPSSFSLISPDSVWLNDTMVTFVWHSSYDAGVGLKYYVLVVDGNYDTVGLDTVYTKKVSEGWHDWYVIAIDNADKSTCSDTLLFGVDITIPPSPSMVSPADNETLYSYPTFIWNSVTDAPSGLMYYELVVKSISDSYKIHTLDTIYTLTLTQTGIWVWTVRAYDKAGNASTIANIWRFNLDDTIAPSVPQLVSPDDGGYSNDGRLVWRSSTDDLTGVSYYVVDYSTDPTFAIKDSGTTVDTEFIIPDLQEATYYWRVYAVDGAGNRSGYSSVWSFSVDTVPPGVPSLISPVNGAYINTPPTLVWTSAGDNAGIAGYEVEIYSFDGGYAETAFVLNDTTCVVVPQIDADFVWHVRAVDLAGNRGEWSEKWGFVYDTKPPATPLPSFPKDVRLNDTIVVFRWYLGSEAKGGVTPVDYIIEVYTDSGLTSLLHIDTVEVNYDTVKLLQPYSEYWWRVKAMDEAGNESDWSTLVHFVLDTLWAAGVGTDSPIGAFNTSSVKFVWRFSQPWYAPGTLQGFELKVVAVYPPVGISSDEFSSMSAIVDTVLPAGQTQCVITLPDSEYFWSVRAWNTSGKCTPWADIRHFKIDTKAPPAPALVYPEDGGVIGDTNVKLECQNVEELETGYHSVLFYVFVVSDDPNFMSIIRCDTVKHWYYTYVKLTEEKTYYWKARAFDEAGNVGPWSVTYSFTLDLTKPTVTSYTVLSDTTYPGPFWVKVVAVDNCGVDSAKLIYRASIYPVWIPVAMMKEDKSTFKALIPKQDPNTTVEYYFVVKDIVGNKVTFPDTPIRFTIKPLALVATKPVSYELQGVYPNPVRDNLVIKYALPEESRVRITLCDITGREVKELLNIIQSAGRYTYNVKKLDLAGGIYFVKFQAGNYTKSEKILVTK